MQSYQNPPPGSYGTANQPAPQQHTTVYLGSPEQTLFNTKEIRSKFVSKVYTIVFFQILFASALIGWFTLHEPTHDYIKSHGDVYLYVAFGVGIVTLLILSCVQSARRTFPANFILLTIVTISFGLIAAVTSARFDTITVLCAFGATAFSTFVIILLAKYSPFDITGCGCALCVLALVHLVAGLLLTIILVPMGYGQTASLLLASFGAFLVSMYMLYDLQLIMGGRSYELSPEEYIMAAVTLYIDIINLFQYLLILFGSRD